MDTMSLSSAQSTPLHPPLSPLSLPLLPLTSHHITSPHPVEWSTWIPCPCPRPNPPPFTAPQVNDDRDNNTTPYHHTLSTNLFHILSTLPPPPHTHTQHNTHTHTHTTHIHTHTHSLIHPNPSPCTDPQVHGLSYRHMT